MQLAIHTQRWQLLSPLSHEIIADTSEILPRGQTSSNLINAGLRCTTATGCHLAFKHMRMPCRNSPNSPLAVSGCHRAPASLKVADVQMRCDFKTLFGSCLQSLGSANPAWQCSCAPSRMTDATWPTAAHNRRLHRSAQQFFDIICAATKTLQLTSIQCCWLLSMSLCILAWLLQAFLAGPCPGCWSAAAACSSCQQ
jgi:hypothetical protein